MVEYWRKSAWQLTQVVTESGDKALQIEQVCTLAPTQKDRFS